MPELEKIRQKRGQPQIYYGRTLFSLIEDFSIDPDAHAELLSRNGVGVKDREALKINYLAFSLGAVGSVLDRRDDRINHRYFSTKGASYLGKNEIDVYVGHNYRFLPNRLERAVDMPYLNATARHEVGHYVDEVVNGSIKPEFAKRATIAMGRFGFSLTRVPKALTAKEAFYYLNPVYFDMPMQTVAMAAATFGIGAIFALTSEKLYDLAYMRSPQEKYANEFASANENFSMLHGRPIDFDIENALKSYAKALFEMGD